MPCERKSVEPMAAITAPARVSAQHQSLLHFVGKGGWSDETVLAKVRDLVLPEIERHGPIEAWIIDDTGFPKQGRHSVGVARQYCGQLGKQDNCQVAVSLSIANHHASLPVAYRLYLPKDWAADALRRRKAGVPEEIVFKTKPEIALDQLRWACQAGLAARRGADRRRVWQQHRVAHGDHGVGVDLCGRHSAEHHGHGRPAPGRCHPSHGRAAVGSRSVCAATPSISRSQSRSLHLACQSRLAHDHMARRHGRAIVLALCACACSRCASR